MTVVPYRASLAVQGIELLAQLERAGAVTDTGLDPDRFDATYDECEALAAMCGHVKRVTSWILGDVLLYSEARHGERYAQIEAATGLAVSTLQNYCSISKRVPPARRRASLDHGHHAEVAALEPHEQIEWLDKAEAEGWKRDELRAALRVEKSGEPCDHEYVCRRCGQLQ